MQKHQYLVSLMEDRKEELLKLCSDLIKIPSVNPPGEMEAITSFICRYLEEHHISYEVLYPTPTTPNIVATLGRKGGRRETWKNGSLIHFPGKSAMEKFLDAELRI